MADRRTVSNGVCQEYSDSFTVNGVKYPVEWYSVVEALIIQLQQAAQDRVVGRITLELELQQGKVRDRYIATRAKIA